MNFRIWVIFLAVGLYGCGRSQEMGVPGEEHAVRDEAEAKAIATIKSLGGFVKRDDTKSVNSFVVVLTGASVTDATLKELAPLKGLSTLSIRNAGVTDEGLKELAQFQSLTLLNISDTNVTDAGLKELGTFKQLISVTLYRTKATEAGLAELKKALPQCRVLTEKK